jgi:AcrR family transcriptional regulator
VTTWASTLKQHKARQHDLILDAAGDIFNEKGISGLSMSALASRAGMTRPTLYNYFTDVDAVIAAYGRREVDRYFKELRDQLDTEEGPAERIESFVRLMVIGYKEHAHEADWMKYVPADNSEHDRTVDPLRDLLAEILRSGIELGVFRSDIDTYQVAKILFDMTESIHVLTHSGGDEQHLADLSVDFTRRILSPS